MLFVVGAAFLVFGVLFVTNVKGFTESAFRFLVKLNPGTPANASYRVLQIVGGVWVLMGALCLLVGFSGTGR